MAEALINHLGAGSYKAVSAGSNPTGEVHPKSIETLERHGIPAHEPRSKSWDEFEGEKFDLVITVCDAAAGQSCPIFFGKHEKLHWSTPDPAAVTGSEEDITVAFDEAFNMLKIRIERELLSDGRVRKKTMSSLVLSNAEKEIVVLMASWQAIGEMVNNSIMIVNHRDPDSSIMFNTSSDKKYFGIILLDFLNSKIFGVGENCLDSLLGIIQKPIFNEDVGELKNSAESFKEWLEEDVQLDHDGETRTFWFPSIDTDIALKIKRIEFIKICGNISKHNMLGLGRQAEIILQIFKRNEVDIELPQALLIMEEFYEQFHNDLFTYHSSAIAEFLNNIRWEIYNYLKPLFDQSIEYYPDKAFYPQLGYKYNYPENISNEYAKEIFWNLMNEIRSKPYVPKFKVSRFFKMRY